MSYTPHPTNLPNNERLALFSGADEITRVTQRCISQAHGSERGAVIGADRSSFHFPVRVAPSRLPVHFFTIVLNGMPFMKYHIEVFTKLSIPWHWHIIEGVADLKHDTAWSLENGARIDGSIHLQGRSNDGTSEYIDTLAQEYPKNISVYRKPLGEFWQGKLEMVNAPLERITEEALLWQVDSDELWSADQIRTMWEQFHRDSTRTAAYFYCHYFVGEKLVTCTRNTYGNNTGYEWLRAWRYQPGCRWTAHEPPRLCFKHESGHWIDLAAIRPFTHAETEGAGLIFQHFAYVTPAQLKFKESYYGYKDAVASWQGLQLQQQFPKFLREYFPWVKDGAQVTTADSLGIQPIASTNGSLTEWKFQIRDGGGAPQRILYVRPDAIGDNVIASSAVRGLRARFPWAEITVCCQERVRELYEHCPYIQAVISFDRTRALQDGDYLEALLKDLQGRHFDLATHDVYSPEPLCHLLTLATRATTSAALGGDTNNQTEAEKANFERGYQALFPTHPGHSELLHHTEYLRGFGLPISENDSPKTEVWLSPEDLQWAEQFLAQAQITPGTFIGMFAASQLEFKNLRSLGEGLRPIVQQRNMPVLAFGAPADAVLNETHCRATGGRYLNLSGKTTLRQCAALLKLSAFAVGTDTAQAHIATALGVKTVVVLGGGHFGRFFPYAANTSVIALPLECYGCNYRCKYSRAVCVQDISAAAITEGVLTALRLPADRPRIFVQGSYAAQHSSLAPQPGMATQYYELLRARGVEVVRLDQTQTIREPISSQPFV